MNNRFLTQVDVEDTLKYHSNNEWSAKSLPPYYIYDELLDKNILVRGSGNSVRESICPYESNDIDYKEFIRIIRRLAHTRRQSVHARLSLTNELGEKEDRDIVIDEIGNAYLQIHLGTGSFESNVHALIQVKPLLSHEG